MKSELIDLIKNTILIEFSLPCINKQIDKTIISTENDACLSAKNIEELIKIIYNSILYYSFEEFEIEGKNLETLQYRALKTRIRYNKESTENAKIKYGFFGEVLLYSILHKIFNAKTLMSRGHFYSISSKSETAGYDCYHLIDKSDNLELWFGEVKFYQCYKKAINSALKNIENVISDEYLTQNNLIAIFDKATLMNRYPSNSKITTIITKWEENPEINLTNELVNNKIKLVYPILIVYDKKTSTYQNKIDEAVRHIKDNFSHLNFNKITIEYSLFFIFLPVDKVKYIKEEVIKCIEFKKPLI